MDYPITFYLRWADANDADIIANMVQALRCEIAPHMSPHSFDMDLATSAQTARRWLEQGHYQALLAYRDEQPLGMTTVAQTYALYAGGAIGVIQEFFVARQARSNGLGGLMLKRVGELARRRGWHALELYPPPLPDHERALSFYQRHDFLPISGFKMWRSVSVTP